MGETEKKEVKHRGTPPLRAWATFKSHSSNTARSAVPRKLLLRRRPALTCAQTQSPCRALALLRMRADLLRRRNRPARGGRCRGLAPGTQGTGENHWPRCSFSLQASLQ